MFSTFPSIPEPKMLFSTPPYIFTNEVGTTATIHTLQKLPQRGGQRGGRRLHIGVSGLFNYDIIAARKSHGAILWDINEETQILHKLVQTTICGSATAEKFITKFAQIAQKVSNKILVERNPCLLEDLRYEASKQTSWLAKNESYQHIRSLYQKNCVQISYGNWLDSTLLLRIANWVRQNGLILDTVYLSNCGDPNWMKIGQSLVDSKKAGFLHHPFSLPSRISPLLQTGTYIIETSATNDLNQKICKIQKGKQIGIVASPVFTHRRPLHEYLFMRMAKNPHETAFFLLVITTCLVYKWLQMTAVESHS